MCRPNFLQHFVDATYGRPGVYAIIERDNQRKYIGQSSNIGYRVARHFFDLGYGVHPNRELQKDYDNQGEVGFGFSVLLESGDELERRDYEQLRIQSAYCSCYSTYDGEDRDGKRRLSGGKLSNEQVSLIREIGKGHMCYESIATQLELPVCRRRVRAVVLNETYQDAEYVPPDHRVHYRRRSWQPWQGN